MNNFKDYLSESAAAKKYNFRVKVAGDFSADQEAKLKTMLEKFQVDAFKKLSVTPVQKFPLDFPQIKNCEVSIFEVTVNYPTTPQELKEYLGSGLSVNSSMLAVVTPGMPSEEYQREDPKREGALLTDSEYKEAPNANFEDYYGDKYNTGFVKELNDILKLQRKARGEVIPETAAAVYNTDKDAGTTTVLIPNKDPRK